MGYLSIYLKKLKAEKRRRKRTWKTFKENAKREAISQSILGFRYQPLNQSSVKENLKEKLINDLYQVLKDNYTRSKVDSINNSLKNEDYESVIGKCKQLLEIIFNDILKKNNSDYERDHNKTIIDLYHSVCSWLDLKYNREPQNGKELFYKNILDSVRECVFMINNLRNSFSDAHDEYRLRDEQYDDEQYDEKCVYINICDINYIVHTTLTLAEYFSNKNQNV